MIIVLEPVCAGEEHVQFNASILTIAGLLAQDGRVVFWGEDEHHTIVNERRSSFKDDCIVEFRSINIPPRHLDSIPKRLPRDFEILNRVLSIQSHESIELIIITCVTESMLLAAKIKFAFLPPSIPVILIFHSILPGLLISKKRRLALSFAIPSQMKLVVLGQHIIKNLSRDYPSLSKHFSAIEHPYNFPNQGHPIAKAPVTSFGFLGLGNGHKGFPLFLELIKAVSKRFHEKQDLRFSFIGRVAPDCTTIFQEFLSSPFSDLLQTPANRVMPRDEYDAAVSKLDYIIMPYDDKFYRYVYSGSSLDALLYLKPIIALKGTFFDSLFSTAGDIGYLCNNMSEMIAIVHDLIENPDPARWAKQRDNLFAARQYYSPHAIANSLARISGRALC